MAAGIPVSLRGYERTQVDELLGRADAALAGAGEIERAAARDALRQAGLRITMRGYNRQYVDRAIAKRIHLLEQGQGTVPAGLIDWEFTVVLRGFDPAKVDAALTRAEEALAGGDPRRREAARDELGAGFEVLLRGYDRGQVDQVVGLFRAVLGYA